MSNWWKKNVEFERKSSEFRQLIAKLPRNPLEKANSIIIQAFPIQNFLISGRNSAKIGPNFSHNNKNHCVIYFIMSSFDKRSLNLREPEDALVWLDAFAANFWAEKKTDVAATADFQITDHVLFRCGVDSLKKLKCCPKGIESHTVFLARLREAAQFTNSP